MAELLAASARGGRFAGQLARGAARLVAGVLRDLTRSKQQLVAVNVALRAQLATLKRQVGRAAPDEADRVLMVAVSRLLPNAAKATLHMVRPETLKRWHKDLARWLWAWRSRPKKPRRPPNRTPDEIRELVIRMAGENGWGSLRIVGELAKLDVFLARCTVQRILHARWPNGRPEPTQGWQTWIRNHLVGTWACDFFTVTTLGFRTLYVLFFMRLDTREIVHANVTAHPTGEWTAQQLRHACGEEEAPERLIRDRDKKFTAAFDEVVESKGGEILLTPYRTPVANCFAERMVGTFRRELFDHVIPRDEDHVRELLAAYLPHYHKRSHQGLELRSPAGVRRGEGVKARDPTATTPDLSKLVVTPVLGGLVHEYALVA